MTAESVHIWANGLLIISLIVGVVATYAIVVSGNIKEKKFKAELSQANGRAAEANQKAAELNERAASLEKEAATARLELEKLKKKQAPWTLSKNQISRLKDLLMRAPKGAIEVRYIISEAERAGKFAKTLAIIFKQCGYDVYPEIGMFSNTSDPPPVGLFLIFRSEQDRERALTYCKIFNAMAIPAECAPSSDADIPLDPWINKAVSIYVRNKPG